MTEIDWKARSSCTTCENCRERMMECLARSVASRPKVPIALPFLFQSFVIKGRGMLLGVRPLNAPKSAEIKKRALPLVANISSVVNKICQSE